MRYCLKVPGDPDRWAHRDSAGFWSLWDDPAKATNWPDEFAAHDALQRAISTIRFKAIVTPAPEV